MPKFKNLAEAEAYAERLEKENADQKAALAAKVKPITITITSNCGQTTRNKAGDGDVTCKVDPATMKCSHGGTPKGTMSVNGINAKYPVTLYGDQWERIEPVIADVLALKRKWPQYFTRKGA